MQPDGSTGLTTGLIARTLFFARSRDLLRPGDAVIVACSSGPDSVFLFHFLLAIKDQLFLRLYLAHLNHLLRGQASENDEQFVRELGSQFNIPVYTQRRDIKGLSEATKQNLEECGRRERYRFLHDLANEVKADRIATGHTAEDQAETVLMHLIRGAGTGGLSGIPVQRGKIIRPLLTLRKKEIRAWLVDHKYPFRYDSSNLSKEFLRNRIREDLIPHLAEEYNPRIIEVLSRTASILEEQNAYLEWFAQQMFESCLLETDKYTVILDLQRFIACDLFVRRLIIRCAWQALTDSAYAPSFDTIERVLSLAQSARAGHTVPLGSGYTAGMSQGRLIFWRQSHLPVRLEFRLPGVYHWNDYSVKLEAELGAIDTWGIRSNSDQWVAYLDYDRLEMSLVLRSVEPGDRFCPLGTDGHKKVGDFFTDTKVPLYLRQRALVITTKNEIVWLVGYRVSNNYKVTDTTRRVVRIRVKVGKDETEKQPARADYISSGDTKAG